MCVCALSICVCVCVCEEIGLILYGAHRDCGICRAKADEFYFQSFNDEEDPEEAGNVVIGDHQPVVSSYGAV